MRNLAKATKNVLLVSAVAATLASCGGGGGGGSTGGGTPVVYPDYYNSYNINAMDFVKALNDVDTDLYYANELIKDTDETYRDGNWFVIWDERYQDYVAVDLDYVRALEYYDYYYNNYKETVSEFRDVQDDDQFWNGLIGDGFGDNYEIVTYEGTDLWGDAVFEGIDSGMLYEDAEESKDVSLMAKEKEEREFFEKAAQVSFTYNVDMKASLSLVTLGKKVENALVKSNGELTEEDQLALLNDVQTLTGVTLKDIEAAADSAEKKEEVVNTIAEKIGTSADNLENRLLPEVFGINI